MKTEFSTPEIERTLGIPRARLKMWIAEGHIVPSMQSATGRGTRHIFGKDDLYVIDLYRELLAQGVRRSLAGDVVKRFAREGHTFSEAIELGYRYLVISRWTPDDETPFTVGEFMLEIPSTLAPNQEYVWAFNLQRIRDRVDRQIT